jgi:hypothetical protein
MEYSRKEGRTKNAHLMASSVDFKAFRAGSGSDPRMANQLRVQSPQHHIDGVSMIGKYRVALKCPKI